MRQLQAAGHAGAAMGIGDREPQERHRLQPGDHLPRLRHDRGLQVVGDRLHRIHDHQRLAALGIAHGAVAHIHKACGHKGGKNRSQMQVVLHDEVRR